MREWLKLMLEEIRRREAEEASARQDVRGPGEASPPAPAGEAEGKGGSDRNPEKDGG